MEERVSRVHRVKPYLPWLLTAGLVVACVGASLPSNGSAGEEGKIWRDAPVAEQPLLPKGYSPLPSLSGIVRKIKPAVFNVQTTQVIKPRVRSRRDMPQMDPFFEQFFGLRPFGESFEMPQREMKRNSLGSGFFVSPDGYAITNHHVIADATEISVSLADEHTYPAKVIGSDPDTDLALLKVEVKGEVPFAALGDSDRLEVGDWVIAIGNPFGLGQTVTAGIISGKERQLRGGPYDAFLQTDASINPGNSGGPLFDTAGTVVGINTAIIAGGSGVGFAVPINLAKSLLPQLKTAGKVTRGWLGIGIQNLEEDLAEKFGVDLKSGVLVSQVYEDSPAERAGLKAGDIVLTIDGKPVRETTQLTTQIGALSPGSKVTLEVLRDGKKNSIKVDLGERKKGLAQVEGSGDEGGGAAEANLGLKLSPLTPERARRQGISEDLRGLLVEDVDNGGPTAGIVRPGDVIVEVNRKRVASLGEFTAAVGKSEKKGSVLMRLQRGNAQIYVVIRK